MINGEDYKLHPKTLEAIQMAMNTLSPNSLREHKPNLLEDMVFISLFLYARRVGTDKEHIEYLSNKLDLTSLDLTDLLGSIDKYQKELGV